MSDTNKSNEIDHHKVHVSKNGNSNAFFSHSMKQDFVVKKHMDDVLKSNKLSNFRSAMKK